MSNDLWMEASRDYDQEAASVAMTRAKVATAKLWPFLSMARSAAEFEHRLALAASRIEDYVGAEMMEPLVASLREDFVLVSGPAEPVRRVAVSTPDRQVQIFHEASGTWLTVDAVLEGDTQVPEEGPLTGETGGFPAHPTGADPLSPLQAEYPMQPTQWSGAGKPAWTDQPMSFAPYRQAAANPDYFSGGTEGVAGDEQTDFPADDSLDEPDYRVDEYGSVPPQPSSGSRTTVPYSNSGNLRNTRASGFFDPADASVRVVAAGDDLDGGQVGTMPDAPPSMMPGGPGSEAMPPMGQSVTSPSDMAAKQGAQVRDRPDAYDSPSGVADEYDDNNWDAPAQQRPMQSAEHRRVNTPQRPQDRDPIPQNSSEGAVAEEERREASLRAYLATIATRVASSVTRELVAA